MNIPANARRVNPHSIVFVPSDEERQIANLKQENDKMKKRLEKIEAFLLRSELL